MIPKFQCFVQDREAKGKPIKDDKQVGDAHSQSVCHLGQDMDSGVGITQASANFGVGITQANANFGVGITQASADFGVGATLASADLCVGLAQGFCQTS